MATRRRAVVIGASRAPATTPHHPAVPGVEVTTSDITGTPSAAAPASALVKQLVRPALMLLVLALLASGVAGGLLRAGLPVGAGLVIGRAALGHATLMLAGLLATVIALERAVAVGRRWAFAAPLASAAGALALLAGADRLSYTLLVVAAAVLLAVHGLIWQRQRAAHVALLLVGAATLLAGNLLLAWSTWAGGPGDRPGDGPLHGAVLTAWFSFVVLTIAAERLEMTRLLRSRAWAGPLLQGIVALLLIATVCTAVDPRTGGVLYGLALMAQAAWLLVFDIARRTVRSHGLARYMAIALLAGHGWLGVAGLAWLGTALGCPGRDMALHALGLGFIMSMVMAHAPVILPALTRIKLLFGAWFYLPLALLHGSLALRLFAGMTDSGWRQLGTTLNAVALGTFLVTVAGSALAWRRRHPR